MQAKHRFSTNSLSIAISASSFLKIRKRNNYFCTGYLILELPGAWLNKLGG
jgi:hypothetical protein